MGSLYQTLNSFGYTHPLHPTLVYLPIGCVMAAFIFGTIAVLFGSTNLQTSAKHCIILALIAVFPTIFLGYMDWQHFHGGNFSFPIKMKMLLAGVLVILLFITAVYQKREIVSRKNILLLYTLCFFNVIAIGYFGGEIVFGGHSEEHNKSESTHAEEQNHSEPEHGEAEKHATGTVTFLDVVEIFHRNCIECHKGSGAPYNLQLDTYEHVMAGGLEGKVIIPGKPDESELVQRIKGQVKPAMPYRKTPLPDATIEKIVHWIEQGAKEGPVDSH